MASQPQLQNIWHLRSVAESAAKECPICRKSTSKVLITPDNKDFFYICESHLTDRAFASPIVDPKAEEAKKKKEAMDLEIQKVKEEYEEKQRKKKSKKKDKSKDKDKKDDKKDDSKDEDEDAKDEKDRDEKINSIKKDAEGEAKVVDGPRIFALHRDFYQMRVTRIRNAEIAKRNQQRMNTPNLFPSVPKGDLA